LTFSDSFVCHYKSNFLYLNKNAGNSKEGILVRNN
jgi:hypothetical protein